MAWVEPVNDHIERPSGITSRAYAPNQEECVAEVVTNPIKWKAAEHPEQPRAQLLRTEFACMPNDGLSQLPDQPALV